MRGSKGLSFTLTIVVVAVVLLVAAFTVMGIGGGFISDFGGILSSGSPSDQDFLRQQCLDEKTRLCSDSDFVQQLDDEREWARNARAEGETCWTLAEDEQIFGPDGAEDIPPC